MNTGVSVRNRRLLLALVLAGALLAAWLLVSASLLRATESDGDVQPAATDCYVSIIGTDSGGCTVVMSPCKTIQFAVDVANPRGRVLVVGASTDPRLPAARRIALCL